MYYRILRILSMLRRSWNQHFFLIWTVLFSCFLFLPAINNFFLGDDWFHLKIIQISSAEEFLNFFNPIFNPQSTAFFRPIPNQLFFFTFYKLFGLWALPYYIFLLFIFASSIVLFYLFLRNFKLSQRAINIAIFFYATSHTHFTRLNFLSAGQEIML